MTLRILGVSLICIAVAMAVVKNRAHATDKIIKDRNERVIGSIRDNPTSKGNQTIRDRYERPVGTLKKEREKK